MSKGDHGSFFLKERFCNRTKYIKTLIPRGDILHESDRSHLFRFAELFSRFHHFLVIFPFGSLFKGTVCHDGESFHNFFFTRKYLHIIGYIPCLDDGYGKLMDMTV